MKEDKKPKFEIQELKSINELKSTPETRYSKRARQTPFVYYIESFTISRQSISIKSREGSWVLFIISRILLYGGLLYRVSGVLLSPCIIGHDALHS